MIYKNISLTLLFAVITSSYLGKWFWIFDILSSFRVYYILISIVFFLFFIRFKNKSNSALLLTAIIIQTFTVYHSYNPPKIISNDIIAEEITLLQYNAYYLNKNFSEIVEYITKNHAQLDIIFLQEVTSKLKEELKAIEKYYPYKIINNEKWFDRAFYSKLPISNSEIKFFNNFNIDPKARNPYYSSHIHYMTVYLESNKHSIPLTIYGIHANAPLSKKFANLRNIELKIIADDIKNDVLNKHKILVGDFNTTPFSYWYHLLEESSGLMGTGFCNTWPNWIPFNLLKISIDNILVSNNITIEEKITKDSMGSDHLPVIIKLKLNVPDTVLKQF